MKFVFDLDGTICFKGQPVSEKILTGLEALTGAGHEVIFASARPIRDMLPVLHERFHSFSLIGGNGSLLSKAGKSVHAEAFEDDVVKSILKLIEEHQATYLIDSEWDYAYTGPQDHPILNNVDPSKLARCLPVEGLKAIVKILILTAEDMEGLAASLEGMGVVMHRHRNEQVIDISPQHIHKWSALQRLGVGEGEYIAFGNDANDISMFQYARHAVMMGHHEALAPYASEGIPLEGDVEEAIVRKLKELSALFIPDEI